jgi:hypothetical protein
MKAWLSSDSNTFAFQQTQPLFPFLLTKVRLLHLFLFGLPLLHGPRSPFTPLQISTVGSNPLGMDRIQRAYGMFRVDVHLGQKSIENGAAQTCFQAAPKPSQRGPGLGVQNRGFLPETLRPG